MDRQRTTEGVDRSEVWYAIPSASPEKCRKTLPVWREMGYRVAVLQDKVRGEVPADVVLEVERYEGWPASVNRLCREVVPGSAGIIVSGGDDMLPDPTKTAQEIAAEFYERFPDGFGVMQPLGDQAAVSVYCCGSPWMGRAWVDSAYGGRGPLNPEYFHHFADMELYWVALAMKRLWMRPELSQYHDHFERTGRASPLYWTKNVGQHSFGDVRLFAHRAATRFAGCEPAGRGERFDAELFAREYVDVVKGYMSLRCNPQNAPDVANQLVQEALDRCKLDGLEPVAIYGAGQHTMRAARALARPAAEVACVIDDAPAQQGTRLWGYPVVSREGARALGVRAVVISSDSVEDKLAANCAGLAAAGVRVIRPYQDLGSAEAERAKRTVLVGPAVRTVEDLTELYYRMLWYLRPLAGVLEEAVVLHEMAGDARGSIGARPEHIDPAVEGWGKTIGGKIRFVRASDREGVRAASIAADVICVHDIEGATAGVDDVATLQRRSTQQVFRVDRRRVRGEGSHWLKVSENLAATQRAEMERGHAAFRRFAEETGERVARRGRAGAHGGVAYVFGTGPSLALAAAMDFSDGACIACNSMVRNRSLMEQLRPVAIAMADPIFHAGCSAYAGEFRSALVEQVRRHRCPVLVPWRDIAVYRSVMPEDVREWFIGVPSVQSKVPNLDLVSRFELASTANVLTYFLLPVAASVCRTVRVVGCDGRPKGENGYFWKHDPASQINEHMESIKRCHPSFFAIDYDDYYDEHCRTLAAWIDAVEARGGSVENLTASHIPALAARTVGMGRRVVA
jgi:hypothetical protein